MRLHFGGTDPVSALTLTVAACEILRAVAKHRGVHHPFENEILPLVPRKKQKRHEFFRLFKAPQNFLKHARDDPDESLALNPEFTEWLLFEAARTYVALTGYDTPETRVVMVWFLCKYPNVIRDGPHKGTLTFPHARPTLERPDLWLATIDGLRAAYGERLPTDSKPT